MPKTPLTDEDMWAAYHRHQTALQRAVDALERWLFALTVAALLLAAAAGTWIVRERLIGGD